jgi:S-formylglutathione hydrolase FrmB
MKLQLHKIMSLTREGIFDDIDFERYKQQKLWGPESDAKNTVNDWCQYINTYAAKAASTEVSVEVHKQREFLVKVAALAVAALEILDSKGEFAPRHFDRSE